MSVTGFFLLLAGAALLAIVEPRLFLRSASQGLWRDREDDAALMRHARIVAAILFVIILILAYAVSTY